MRNPDTLSANQPAPPEDTPQGLAFAIGAYGLWGFLPLYMKAMAHIPAAEIVVHRVIWSAPGDGLRHGDAYFGQLGDLHLGGELGSRAGCGLGLLYQPAI